MSGKLRIMGDEIPSVRCVKILPLCFWAFWQFEIPWRAHRARVVWQDNYITCPPYLNAPAIALMDSICNPIEIADNNIFDCLPNKHPKPYDTTKMTTKRHFFRPKKPYNARMYSILLYTTRALVSASCALTAQTLADCNPTHHRPSAQPQPECLNFVKSSMLLRNDLRKD